MSGNVPDFIQRKHRQAPDYDIEVWITGVRVSNGDCHWNVTVEGEDDSDLAAGMLERAAEVLRDKDCETVRTSANEK